MEKVNKMLLIVLLLIFILFIASCTPPPKTHYASTPKKSNDVLKKIYFKSGRTIIDCDIVWEGVESQIACKKSQGIAVYSAEDVDLIKTFGERSGKEIGKRYEAEKKKRELLSKATVVTPEQEDWWKKQRLQAQKRPENSGSLEDLTALRDVDLINISSYIQDQVLTVSILYNGCSLLADYI